MSDIKLIDLSKLIEEQRRSVDYMLKKTVLTDEQLQQGYRLCNMSDIVNNKGQSLPDHKCSRIFNGMADLLGYDCSEAMQITRERIILEELEEVEESNGYCIYQKCSPDLPDFFVTFTSDSISQWDDAFRTVVYSKFNELPEYIRKNELVQKILEKLGDKKDKKVYPCESICKEENPMPLIMQKRIELGMSRSEMSRRFGIPLRTLESWDAGSREPSKWVSDLIIEKLESMKKH